MSDYLYWPTTSSGTTSNVLYFDSTTTAKWNAPNPQPVNVVEGAPKPEDPIAWLRRRVAEVCWTPA